MKGEIDKDGGDEEKNGENPSEPHPRWFECATKNVFENDEEHTGIEDDSNKSKRQENR